MRAALAIAFFWGVPLVLSFYVGKSKDRTSPVWLTLVFGWLGLLASLLMPPAGKTCPRCAETVKYAATVCRYCGAKV